MLSEQTPTPRKKKPPFPDALRTRSVTINTKVTRDHRTMLGRAMSATGLTLCAALEKAIEALDEKLTREREILNRQA